MARVLQLRESEETLAMNELVATYYVCFLLLPRHPIHSVIRSPVYITLSLSVIHNYLFGEDTCAVAQWLEHWSDARKNLRAVVLIPGKFIHSTLLEITQLYG